MVETIPKNVEHNHFHSQYNCKAANPEKMAAPGIVLRLSHRNRSLQTGHGEDAGSPSPGCKDLSPATGRLDLLSPQRVKH